MNIIFASSGCDQPSSLRAALHSAEVMLTFSSSSANARPVAVLLVEDHAGGFEGALVGSPISHSVAARGSSPPVALRQNDRHKNEKRADDGQPRQKHGIILTAGAVCA
jgi:hypothetical protein